jgi:cytochrome P450
MADLDDVDLFDPAVQQDWYPTYDLLREQAPVYRIPGSDMYVLTRYADVQYALRHPELFPNGRGANTLLATDTAKNYWAEHGWRKQTPLGSNPPEHRLYRELIDHFFDARAAQTARPMAEDIAGRLLDDWAGQQHVEFVAGFALPLPVEIITRIIGFPVGDIPQLRVWSAAWVMPFHMRLTPDEEMYVAEQGVAFQRYINAMANERRVHPTDDVLSHLATATIDLPGGGGPRPLEDWEIINLVDHLFIGGNETTTFALTSGLMLILQDAALESRLRADPSLIPEFVEENLRLESPTQGLFRLVAADVTLSGTTIPAGATVHLRYAAANRDGSVFTCPADVDLERTNKRRHVAFAVGEHHCPGAELSRMEQIVAFTELLRRFPVLRLSGTNDFHRQSSFVLRALEALHLEIGA